MSVQRFGPPLPAALALVLSGCGPGETGSSSAGCAAPHVSVDQTTATGGETVTVRGRGFSDFCDDTDSVEGRTPPETDISILFTQGGTTEVLTTVDAESDYTFTATVTIPPAAAPGEATITADIPSVETVPIDITR
ncbi:hypothetical protein PU560_17430 [Georgenia sp. 10Sc9-8]|uniref:IPT/TIG domain-containing protein n=1 Tax=Georgenia halotolerans TaxID=3028317 RepID=A0ABT5U2T6_9MICO|nr:hypothetical protein [Georgenia halotolerans]